MYVGREPVVASFRSFERDALFVGNRTAIHSEEFKRDEVRTALTIGLIPHQIAPDPVIGLTSLDKWICAI